MTNDRDVKGVVSWRSIGVRSLFKQQGDSVRHFMDDAPPEVPADRAVFFALPTIIERGFVLVRGPTRVIEGIVTATDVSEQFKERAEPFLLIGEIENNVRRLIGPKLTTADLASVKEPDDTRPLESVLDLTFGQYVRLLQPPDVWERVGLPVDRAVFTRLLDEVREVRNDIMHFDPDPLEPERLETLRRFTQFLQTIQAHIA